MAEKPPDRRPIAGLPTLADLRATRRAVPKAAIGTRVAEADRARLKDEQRLEAWRRIVRERDQMRDRYTGALVEVTIALTGRRAEVHHHEPRENLATRYDPRNGILLSLTTHQQITRGALVIRATRGSTWFRVAGRRYLNVGGPVRFVPRP